MFPVLEDDAGVWLWPLPLPVPVAPPVLVLVLVFEPEDMLMRTEPLVKAVTNAQLNDAGTVYSP